MASIGHFAQSYITNLYDKEKKKMTWNLGGDCPPHLKFRGGRVPPVPPPPPPLPPPLAIVLIDITKPCSVEEWGPGGGGGLAHILTGIYVPRQSEKMGGSGAARAWKGGALERALEREIGVSGADL